MVVTRRLASGRVSDSTFDSMNGERDFRFAQGDSEIMRVGVEHANVGVGGAPSGVKLAVPHSVAWAISTATTGTSNWR